MQRKKLPLYQEWEHTKCQEKLGIESGIQSLKHLQNLPPPKNLQTKKRHPLSKEVSFSSPEPDSISIGVKLV